MDILAGLVIIVFSIIGLMFTIALKNASLEMGKIGNALIEESKKAQDLFTTEIRNQNQKSQGIVVDNLSPKQQEEILSGAVMTDESFDNFMNSLLKKQDNRK
jgi:parvulin-like peptidyl-prolyl isomerase